MSYWKKMYEHEVTARKMDQLSDSWKPSAKAERSSGVIEGRKEIAEIVLDLLGLREDYPTKTERVATGSGYSLYYTDVKVSGAGDFVKDLLAAKDAINGQASLKKIRKALKNKEEK